MLPLGYLSMHKNKNKRRLMDSQEEPLKIALRRKRSRPGYAHLSTTLPVIRDDEICARLVTTAAGRTEGTHDPNSTRPIFFV